MLAQSLLLLHPTHDLAGPQTGVGFEHSESPLHWQTCVVMSHVSDPQSEFWRHCTHWPACESPDMSHTPGAQSAFELHARQLLETPSQMGVAPEQSLFVVHSTHTKFNVSQTGVAPVHAEVFDESHWTHCPLSSPPAPHTGVLPVQSAATHARHVSSVEPLDLSQIGVEGEPLQSAFVAHSTHCPLFAFEPFVSQTGVVPVQPTPSSAAVQYRHEGGVVVPLQIGGTAMQAPFAFDQISCTT